MARTLLQRWLDHYDPIHRGWTPAGIANGVCMTAGFFFPRFAGGYNLLRSIGQTPDESASMIVGASSPTAETPDAIANFPTYTLAVDTVYCFWPRAISPGGAQECGPVDAIRIESDDDGDPMGAAPNAPSELTATAIADGYIRLTWRHNAAGEQTKPASWNVYHDDGTGSVDYGTALDDTTHRVYVAGPYVHDTTVLFGVRGVSADDVEETNLDTVSATADTEGPADIGAPNIVEGQET